MADSLIHHVADGQADRIELLEAAVTEHLAKNSRKRARESVSAADKDNIPPVEPLLENLASMWRNAKKTRDYVGAKQALSLLLLPAEDQTKSWTHADIIALVSEVRWSKSRSCHQSRTHITGHVQWARRILRVAARGEAAQRAGALQSAAPIRSVCS